MPRQFGYWDVPIYIKTVTLQHCDGTSQTAHGRVSSRCRLRQTDGQLQGWSPYHPCPWVGHSTCYQFSQTFGLGPSHQVRNPTTFPNSRVSFHNGLLGVPLAQMLHLTA